MTDDDLTLKSMAYSYSGIDPELVETAHRVCNTDTRPAKNVNVGAIAAEEGQDRHFPAREILYMIQHFPHTMDKFDEVWDAAIADYLSSGGQAIMDERAEKWKATFGDTTALPE